MPLGISIGLSLTLPRNEVTELDAFHCHQLQLIVDLVFIRLKKSADKT